MKELLREGSVTKEMVAEMEKSMGINFAQFVKLVDSPAARSGAQKLDPAVLEMVDVFKALNKIKNS